MQPPWEYALKEGSCVQWMVMEGFQKIVYKRTLGKFSIHIMSYCKKIMSVKMEKPISSQSMKIKMNNFFLRWHNRISIDHFLKWVIFGLGFLTSWWISRKMLTYADVISHLSFKYISQMLLFWCLHILWLWIFFLLDCADRVSHTN